MSLAAPGRFLGGDRPAYPKLLHLVNKGSPLHSQSRRSAVPTAYDPIAGLKRPNDVIPLDFLETCHRHPGVTVLMEGFQLGGRGA